MTNIILSGCGGRLGTAIARLIDEREDCAIVCGIDINPYAENHSSKNPYPIFTKISDYNGGADVIIDCSHHSAVTPLLDYAVKNKIPTVIATTGHTDEETALIKNSAKSIPVFYSRNMSVGINLLIELAKKAASVIGADFDIEIVERHHNKKLDAPSGTALMIADAVRDSVDFDAEYVYDRHNVRAERKHNEIGISSIRGGTIIGDHDLIFAGHDEVITISHSAYSRDVFAAGAVRAALYLSDKPCGLYTMSELIGDN